MKAEWLWRHRRTWLTVLVSATLLGIVALVHMPAALFPLVDFPRIVVSVDAGDRPADRMAVEVTRPLEEAIRAVPAAVSVRSTTSRGSAEVSLSMEWGTDMVAALLQVESAVQGVMPRLPPGSRSDVRRMDPTVFPVVGFSLTSRHRSLAELRDLALLQLRPALSSVEGVAEVEVLGGQTTEVQVLLDPVKLEAHGLSVTEVAAQIAKASTLTGVGRLEDRYRLFLVVAQGRVDNAKDVAQVVVRATPGGVVRVADLGEVVEAAQPQWVAVNAQGNDAVLVNIKQQRKASAVNLVGRINDQMSALKRALPEDVDVATYYDQSILVAESRDSVVHAIVIGMVLCGLVLWIFLRSRRATLIVVISLPIVMLLTCVLLLALGQGLNVMTLGGLAAAVGLVVDDAVVVIEHAARRLSEAKRALAATDLVRFALESVHPLLGSSAATVCVFFPLAFLGGIAGGFFRPLALTMAIALSVSFVVSATVVPLLCAWLLSRHDAETMETGQLNERLKRSVLAWSQATMRAPIAVLLGVLALSSFGGWAYTHLSSGFMPHMDEGGFIFDYRAAPGTSLTETDRLLRQVEGIIQSIPEVQSYSRRTGIQLGGGLTEANEGDMFVRLKPPPRRDIEAVMREVRDRVETEVPGLEVETAQLMEDLIGDLIANPQPIEIKLKGPDEQTLRALGKSVADTVSKIDGVVEVFDGTRVAGESLNIEVDPVMAAQEGLSASEVESEVRAALEGVVATTLPVGQREPEVRVWLGPEWRAKIAQLDTLVIRAPDGHPVPLKRVAAITIQHGVPQIVRDDMRQSVIVTARLDGLDLGTAMKRVRTALADLALPNGYSIEYGGLYREQSRAFRELGLILLGVVLLVTSLLVFLYERFDIALAILCSALLTLPGVFVGLWITDIELNVSSLIGLIMVVGVAAELSVFFFAEVDVASVITKPALAEAASVRSRPIIMTSLIAILALSPLALGMGGGADMQRPLAIAIISGLLVAVPIVLFLLPALFTWLQTRIGPSHDDTKHAYG